MKVVLDTNVLVSGMLWQGTPQKIIQAWRRGAFTLVLSLEMMAELSRVLRYGRIGMPDEMIREWTAVLLENAMIVEPMEKFKVVPADPSDDRLFEAAVAGNASYLVTGNTHVLAVGVFHGITVLKPAQFYSSKFST